MSSSAWWPHHLFLRLLLSSLLLPHLSQSRRGPYGTCIPNVDCTPPMGWRSWNAYREHVNQTLLISALTSMSALRDITTGAIIDDDTTNNNVVKEEENDSVAASFASLGYIDVGLDDNWQACHTGAHGSFHDMHGTPLVNHSIFPDLKAMTDHAKSLGMKMGWYSNNCMCSEKCQHWYNQNDDHDGDIFFCFTNETTPTANDIYDGDAKATIQEYGFSSIKVDGCGQFTDLDLRYDYYEHYSKLSDIEGILIENCHFGLVVPTLDWCPFSYYRTSWDIVETFDSVWENAQNTTPFSLEIDSNGNEVGNGGKTLSRPGCWAYPDMMMIGHLANFEEDRSHFGLWCIMSSPLVLGHDITDEDLNKRIWPIISNKEAISVNQAWNGHPGKLVFRSNETIQQCSPESPPRDSNNIEIETLPSSYANVTYQIWMKPLNDTTMALLFVSNGDQLADEDGGNDDASDEVNFPAFRIEAGNSKKMFSIRSIWDNKDLGIHESYYQPGPLAVRDSHFLLVSLVESMDSEEEISTSAKINDDEGTTRKLYDCLGGLGHMLGLNSLFTLLGTMNMNLMRSAAARTLRALTTNTQNSSPTVTSGDDDTTLSFDHFEFCR